MPDEKPETTEEKSDEASPADAERKPSEAAAPSEPAASASAEADENKPSETAEGEPAASESSPEKAGAPAAASTASTGAAPPKKKKKKRAATGAAKGEAAATSGETPAASKEAQAPASTSTDVAAPAPSSGAGEPEFLFPKTPTFAPARPKLRDLLLTAIPLGVLAWIFHVHGDVVFPRGDDPAHPLGHYQSLWHSGHVPGGVPIGMVCVFLAAIGVLGLLGDSPFDLRGDETKPTERDANTPFWKTHGFWLVLFAFALYVPTAGAFGLWDPWETHYSEVAREMLARDDWITTWWGQEGWFMSKPVLVFWLAALGMGFGSAFGLPFWRDMGPGAHEWFIRLPIIFFAIGAVYAVYRAVRSAWGPRAGFMSGMVLATMPHFFFLSHQAMTDMPFVAPLVVAMSFLMMGVVANPHALAEPRVVTLFNRKFRISLWHLCVGAILMVAIPQVLYLLTRPILLGCTDEMDHSCQIALQASRIGPIQFPIEQYWYGSAGNSMFRDAAATVPGSPPWEDRYNQIPLLTSVVQGLIWVAIGIGLMFSFRRERRKQSLYFSMMYLFGAISFMGKGPAGLGVPEVVLLGFMIVTARWKLLPRIRILQGIFIYLLCGFPWYIAIYGRLGSEYTDRFVVHDLLNRAFAGVHGDTGTFRYFVWQLGYAMFPWVGLVPAALVGWRLYVPEKATEAQKDIVRLGLIWFMVTFTLFSLMVTKFHHYIFPTVPAAAILCGLLLDRMLGDWRLTPDRNGIGAIVATVLGVALLVLGITNFVGPWSGRVPHEAPYKLPPGNAGIALALTLLGVAVMIAAYLMGRKSEKEIPPATNESESTYRAAQDAPVEHPNESPYMARYGATALGAVGVGAAVLLSLIGRDIGMSTSHPAGYERFIHLFIYNYERQFPTHSFDYHPILTGFGVVAVLAAAAIAISPLRRLGARSMLALAACFGFWGLDKYMMDLSSHWSQRNLFERYYATRERRSDVGYGEDARYWYDPIVAYQMNWKGENFYTGNHAVMLECGLPLCHDRTNDWLTRHRGERVFFVTEHSRSGSIIGQVHQVAGAGAFAQTITTEFDNNKFVIVEAHL